MLAAPIRYPNHVEPPAPVAGRRLGGVHWWDPDRLHHLEDLPRFCPHCGSDLGSGICVEYWEAERRVYHTWCPHCRWTGDIVRVRRMVGYEPDD
jgi:hypothetical protein